MRTISAASLLALLTLSSEVASQKVIQFDIAKVAGSPPTKLGKRFAETSKLYKRQFSESIINNVTGGSYMISTSIGTPAQSISLVLDTGSSDVWVLADNANQCTSKTLQYEYGACVGGTCKSQTIIDWTAINVSRQSKLLLDLFACQHQL